MTSVDVPEAGGIGEAPPTEGVALSRPAPREHGRLVGLDAARGFALLGILIVNVEYFALPAGEAIGNTPPEGGLALALWWLEKGLCEGKFYPLFSILFGIGLVLQERSVTEAGGRFVPLYLRRVAVLATIGLAHALLLWYGDILFFYSIAAVLLLVVVRLARGQLLVLGLGCWLLAMLAGLGFAQFQIGPQEDAGDWRQVELEGEPLSELTELLTSGLAGGPQDPTWMAAEARLYREGPWLGASFVRALTWGGLLASMLLGGGLQILACFLLGAALLDRGVLASENLHLRVLLLRTGLFVGLLLAAVGTGVLVWSEGVVAVTVHTVAQLASGPVLAVAYLLGWTLLAESGAARPLVSGLAAAGRMALTNYLCQTLVMTFLFYHWGLGWFGTVARADRVGLALLVFAAQVLLSVAWMRRFRFGPAEWAWRSVTYGRVQPWARRE